MDLGEANYAPLSPLVFLERAAQIHPQRPAVIYNSRRFTWSQELQRCRRLASALRRRGIGPGDVVAVVAPNVPAMYEVQFGVPMASAVLNCVNIRLDQRTVATLFHYSGVKAVLVDEEFLHLISGALRDWTAKAGTLFQAPFVVVIRDEFFQGMENSWPPGSSDYEDFLREGDPSFEWTRPEDETETISVSYTSGTTASPKGVMLTHRGAYLSALSECVTWEMKHGCIYLWTLPLFHCNGWCFPWAVAALAGTNICLRQVTAKGIFAAIAEHNVTNFCAAPTVLNTIISAATGSTFSRLQHRQVRIMTAGAAPPATVLAKIEALGFHVTHVYGLTETYGPCTVCEWNPEWDNLSPDEQARLKARQGVKYVGLDGLQVLNSETLEPVAKDGVTIGEVCMRGNMVFKGYLNNPEATLESFRGGWFHSGDLAVWHPDGYIEIKDRAKDIIISGGENISSLEVESILYRHPAVLEAAVVARPDEKWGESPCAFVSLKYGVRSNEEEILSFCRQHLPKFMVPKSVVILAALDKTATGKIQKQVLRSKARALGSVKQISKL
ncbi:acetate/butyrate--CoA ligase AAE7, peroxisomal [Selaginella moellendorffii]|uniref:acetate/butyrate--CoA ligase AAE7, peroxisomal n=1 Tax=Selaginella moellendorffii TaxID=88036 RepID=UPI000D1CCC37|nr:acetate/butyrate--CoA ligase AAE7, peroxisomal [Selaginella moellendorffii]|eukprot:XP_024524878.1 acetate/butyrate--CoA ligase AAE7, peroxisomal [Selaginella moellendorffii]